jgi:DnaJ-class molecular chaperone
VAPLVAPVTAPRPTASGDPSTEIRRRADTLNALDYFQLLGLPTTASAVEVKRAFHAESRAYHPDRFFHLTDVTLKTQVHEVYKRITEAYFVLRDETKRRKYLADITGSDRVRKLRFDEMAEQETKAAVKREVEEQIGVHPKGRQFFQVAMAELDRGQLAAAERNLKLALTYESQNTLYKDKLAQVQERIHEEFRREGKAFKIT